ncbi:U-box-domain-containing protein [Ascoidea rubescens DSM 1968]|uniref:RING-type E3 ubiquitin transferase n=1 Tax=Ascoidea rubescens DSM 1968 TaxID=1344418 RepID=A0A1D2VIA7_9ASCO|nr:U-box-domain-containing protein [Ascoidea rubescens DSM 1968]ODV61381.1 U-box-domain-containing protein [Ascoidea rubescens DSM 1968]
MSAESLKERGNEYFKEGDYGNSIKYYSMAIQHDPSKINYFTNRANARFKLYEKLYPDDTKLSGEILPQEFSIPEEHTFIVNNVLISNQSLLNDILNDCRKAVEIDGSNYKANYYYGLVLFKMNRYEQSYKKMIRAYELAFKINSPSVIQIYEYIIKLRVKISFLDYWNFFRKLFPLYEHLYNLLLNEFNSNIEKVSKKYCSKIELKFKTQRLQTLFKTNFDKILQDPKMRQKNSDVKLDVIKDEIPEYLVDPISFNIFSDPVITPSGKSYEKSWLYKYLHRNSMDPLTRKPLRIEDLYPNLDLKWAAESYIKEHRQIE